MRLVYVRTLIKKIIIDNNMSKKNYEAPVMEVVVVKIESGLLTATTPGVQSSRSSYGTAVEESWD